MPRRAPFSITLRSRENRILYKVTAVNSNGESSDSESGERLAAKTASRTIWCINHLTRRKIDPWSIGRHFAVAGIP